MSIAVDEWSKPSYAIELHYDNQSTIRILENPMSYERLEHGKKEKWIKNAQNCEAGTKMHKCRKLGTFDEIYRGHDWNEKKNSRTKLYKIKVGGT